jgi:hypothetical protein
MDELTRVVLSESETLRKELAMKQDLWVNCLGS